MARRLCRRREERRVWDERWGVPLELTGPNGLTTRWEYDGFGRVLREARADGGLTTTVTNALGHDYDLAPHPASWRRMFSGRRAGQRGRAGGVHVVQRPTERGSPAMHNGKQASQELSRKTTSQDGHPNGLEVAYSYTVDGHVSTLRDAGTAGTRYWQARVYNAAGQLTRFTLGNGVETRRSYSGATGLVERIRSRTTLSPVGRDDVQDAHYSFDLLGNLTRRAQQVRMEGQDGAAPSYRNHVETFRYDRPNRLTRNDYNDGGGNAGWITSEILAQGFCVRTRRRATEQGSGWFTWSMDPMERDRLGRLLRYSGVGFRLARDP